MLKMARLAALPLAVVAGISVASSARSEEFAFEGRLEDGDSTVEENRYSSYYDAFTWELEAGQTLHVEVTGMGITPYFYILNSKNEIAYATSGTSYNASFDWEVPMADTYRILLTQLYQMETPYRLVLSTMEATRSLGPRAVTGLKLHPGTPAKP